MRLFLAALAACAVACPATAAPSVWSGFQTPSHNIVCNGDGSEVSCVVFSASTTCQKTWSLKRTGRASFHCYYSNIGTEVPVLGYGRSMSRFGVHCVSRRTGLTCTNASRHGFFLSRASRRRF